MRSLAGCCGLVMVAVLTSAPSVAHAAEWCAQYQTGGASCSFSSLGQCQTAISGVGGSCSPSPYQDARPPRPAIQRAKAPAKQKIETAVRRPERPAVTTTPAAAPAAVATTPAPAPAAAAMTPAAIAAQPDPGRFAAARKLILDGQYQAGLAAMRALRADNNADVASYIGLAHRKLGRIDEAKSWYGRALIADANHKLTLAFFGMLQAEQGDLPGAQAVLIRIGRLCGGTECNEYRALQGVIASRNSPARPTAR
jgi:Flp pilus assembly protein TadD